MKLYHLKRLDHVGYDEFDEFVIRAKDEKSAREIAFEREAFYPPKNSWLDERLSDCIELLPEGEAGIIPGSYNAG